MAMTLNADEQNRVNNVYNEREKVLAENNSMYEGLINNAGEIRDQQNSYLAEQERIGNENLDKQLNYQTDLINQQKEEAAQNKRVEENKALNDYTAYTNPYGLQNERLYGAGLGNSGVSETSKLGAYSVYQNRVATGAAAYQKAVQSYDNDINQAILNNDVQKAQNALNKLKLQLQNNQDYFSNISSLSQNKLSNENQIRSTYMDQYNTVYNQIMNEQKQAEAIRQYNESMAEQKRQYDINLAYQKERDAIKDAQWQKEYELSKKKVNSSGGRGGYTVKGNNKKTEKQTTQPGSDKQMYQWSTPSLSGKDKEWYNNEFEKHEYKEKDLIWVLDRAPISEKAKEKIYSSYNFTNPKSSSSTKSNSTTTKAKNNTKIVASASKYGSL